MFRFSPRAQTSVSANRIGAETGPGTPTSRPRRRTPRPRRRADPRAGRRRRVPPSQRAGPRAGRKPAIVAQSVFVRGTRSTANSLVSRAPRNPCAEKTKKSRPREIAFGGCSYRHNRRRYRTKINRCVSANSLFRSK